MGQLIIGAPSGTVLVFSCDACPAHADMYEGPDFIEKRGRAHKDGWRQRGGKWFKDQCVPKPNKEDKDAD